MQEKCIHKLYLQSWEGLKGILADASAQTDSRPSSLRTKNCQVVTLLPSCQQEPPWQRQEGVSGGSPIESGKTRCMWSKLVCPPLVNALLKAAPLICWHADNKKAEPELSPQDKKGQRTAIITGFISVAFGVSVNSYGTTMPAGAICCSYCRDICSNPAPVSAAQYHIENINIASHQGFTVRGLHGTHKVDCRQHSDVLVLCHRWRIFYWFLCLIPEAVCFIRRHLKLLAFEPTKALFLRVHLLSGSLDPLQIGVAHDAPGALLPRCNTLQDNLNRSWWLH